MKFLIVLIVLAILAYVFWPIIGLMFLAIMAKCFVGAMNALGGRRP